MNVSGKVTNLNDIEEGILAKIFRKVIGEPVHAWDSVFGRRFEDNKYMTPTCADGFINVLTIPLVCKQWRDIMNRYSIIWSKPCITLTADDGFEETCPLENSICLNWWVKHALDLDSVHLRGFSNIHGLHFGMYNMGLISMLGMNLKTLHLDDCFENGANQALIPILDRLKNMEQLRVMRVNESFVNNFSKLKNHGNLKRVELQGIERGQVFLSSQFFPKKLEVLALALINIKSSSNDDLTLESLKVLKLVHVEWEGSFYLPISKLANLEGLVINNVYIRNEEQSQELNHYNLLNNLKNLNHLEIGGETDPAFSHLSAESTLNTPALSCISKLCLKLQYRSLTPFNLHSKEYFSNLSHLYLECFDFGQIPAEILGLQKLKHLGLVDCNLNSLQVMPMSWNRHLECLDLSKNEFNNFPVQISTLTSLTDLNVSSGNPELLHSNLNFLADLPDLLILRLGVGEFPMFEDEENDFLEGYFRDKASAYKMGSLFTMLQIKNPKCRLYL